ncbi:DUF4318 domain-containing protein [Faecalicatena contorta]|uniref:DUF4318 domain-containing protein n=1 Tax=Faecalicatena contorta TaxID=39482 RepID=UPI00129D7A26|nr:DUF4318 domain-containing protein [Faecalicatena contorta]MRM88897.1 DUF4318 domain-containing protein [Faecalicatena contorta]
MKENRISEETREKIYQGCFLGLLLFASTALFLSLRKDMNEVGRILPFIPAALAGYMVIGNLLVWLHYLPEKGRVSSWFKGAAAVYWIDLIAVGFVLLSFIVSESWRHIILVNAAVVLVCWILDYRSVLKIAKELNGRTVKGRYLVVDLDECPKGAEAFCREIEDYCRKNKIKLEFLQREKPAVILMDGEKYEVTLDFFYSQLGPMYALKFRKDG